MTTLGKLLDPVADKMLTTSALLLIVAEGVIPAPYGVICAIIVISRDIIISALRQIAASKNVILAADKWGKIKTIVMDVALILLLFYAFLAYQLEVVAAFVNIIYIVSLTFFYAGILFNVISCVNYLVKNRKAYTESK